MSDAPTKRQLVFNALDVADLTGANLAAAAKHVLTDKDWHNLRQGG